MFNLWEYRNKPEPLADFLPWAALVAPGIVLNKDGSFQRTARFRGPDLESATKSELVGVTGRLNNALRRLGSGWAIYVEASRHPAPGYPASNFPDPISQLVDNERAAQFSLEGAHFESDYFLTFVWLPPPEEAQRAEAFLYEGYVNGATLDPVETLESFRDRTTRVFDLIEGFVPVAAWLTDGETLTYLHSCISSRRQRVRVPETPMYLDAILPDEPLVGGLAPRIGKMHLRTLTILGFPSVTFPGILDVLNDLAIPYRWSTRAITMDKTEAMRELTKIRRQWFSKRKSLRALVRETATNEPSSLLDSDAANKAIDADAALQELGADMVSHAYVTATVTVWDADAGVADERLRQVEKEIQGLDFTCITETMNAIEAWLGGLPGHVYANVRQPLISTLNLAHMMPLSAMWAGPDRNDHLDGPPLLFAKSKGSTPFRLVLHVGDVGHTLVVGPTGSGKSVLLAMMALQFRRYPNARIFAFDFGGSIRAATLGMGGEWYDLGGSLSGDAIAPVALQPLAAIDDLGERAWAAAWVATIIARQGVAVTPEVRERLWVALGFLADSPRAHRTLTGLSDLIQSNEIRQALQPYCLGGPWGLLLDAEAEQIGDASVQAFEIEGLIGTDAAPAVLAYLFHRIERRLDGSPTVLIVDEAWLALDDPSFGAQVREWLKTWRKKNGNVWFATHSLADIENSPIAAAIIESCPSRIFLPNDRATEPQITRIYERFGLNARQIQHIATATPKRDYYYASQRGNRTFDLGLERDSITLAFTAASSKQDQAAITDLMIREGRDEFARAWMRYKGIEWAIEFYDTAVAARAASAPKGAIPGKAALEGAER